MTSGHRKMYTCLSMLRFQAVLLLLYTFTTTFITGNVLFLSMPGYSRWISTVNVARELNAYGYNITFVLSAAEASSIEDIGAETIISDGMTKYEKLLREEIHPHVINNGFKGSQNHLFVLKQMGLFCPYVLEDEELMATLRKGQYELAIIDAEFCSLCTKVIPYKLSIPFVQMGRFILVHHMRTLIHPAAYPASIISILTDKMTYMQRLQNTLLYLFLSSTPDPIVPRNIIAFYAPETPYINNEQLEARTTLYLLEYDELIDYHLPTYPNVKFVGGLVTRHAEPLTGDMKAFMDSAEEGVVIVSFGSLIKSFPKDVLDKVFEVFRRLPKLRFVFKYGNEAKVEGNVMCSPWLPQNDLLGHYNTKLFVSHCGNNGQYEALYHAVPIICLPINGDQPYNAARIQAKHFGLSLRIVNSTPDDLVVAINKVLNTTTYKDNITKASLIFKNKINTPTRLAAKWIDHVIKYGGEHLHSAVADLPLHQFFLIDIIAGLMVLLLLLLFICYTFCKCLCHLCCKSKVKTD